MWRHGVEVGCGTGGWCPASDADALGAPASSGPVALALGVALAAVGTGGTVTVAGGGDEPVVPLGPAPLGPLPVPDFG
ncbi:MAG: hypothetical protein HY908_20290 [Myxococcales bacterium]|nr:hypothetical protein [Myxococcales bacterium]